MRDFESLDTSEIGDLLGAYLKKYTRILLDDTINEEDLLRTEEMIEKLQEEAKKRSFNPDTEENGLKAATG
ncbi:MAG: hypothetical protein M3N30_10580 [Bacteroidota bacterium]|nr:hypothetical protein [Bacteroidota bacterium]